MRARILMLFAVFLLCASCAVKQETEQLPLPQEQTEGIPVRPPSQTLPPPDRPVACIRCGKDLLPVCNYKRISGFSNSETWGFRTDGRQAEMLFSVPYFMLNKDIALEFPLLSYAFSGEQQNLPLEFRINGQLLLRKNFTEKDLHALKLNIPAEWNRTGSMKLTVCFLSGIRKTSGPDPKEKDSGHPGIGFHFLKQSNGEAFRFSRGIFRIRKITAPDRLGIQQAELFLRDHLSGPEPPETIRAALHTSAIDLRDPAKQYRPGELLDLTLLSKGNIWQIIRGNAVPPTGKDCMSAHYSDMNAYYPPCKWPVNASLPRSVRAAQKQMIADDTKTIRERLKRIRRISALDERFQRDWIRHRKSLERIPKIISPENGQELERFQFQYYWGSRNGSFFALPKDYAFTGKTGIGHNIGALNSFHSILRSCNIQLLVVLVPDAWQIAARALVPEVSRIGDRTALQCASTLLEYGIETIYADDMAIAGIPSAERLFCYPDPRPETALWAILADAAARRLERFGKKFFPESADVHFSERQCKTSFGNNYRWPDDVNCGEHRNGETVESREVFRNGVPFRPDPSSGILVIGGSELNLPGPGHTFTGQLSKRLKYSVDELALSGEVWFQNLAAVLSGNPARYLAGKQICLLMLSPRMLTGNLFPDIREQTALFAGLRNKKIVHRFPLQTRKTDFQPHRPVPGERLYREKLRWNRRWQMFSLKNPPTLSARIENDHQEEFLMKLELPENKARKPYTLVVEAACYPEQASTLLVNGEKIPLLINTDAPHFRPAAAELPPETKTVELKISGRRDNLILIRKILLYQ